MKQGWSGRVWDGRMERYIKHNSEFGLAICVTCRSGIPKDYLLRHFWRNHGATWKECKKALTAYVAGLNLTATADLQCPEGVRSPIDGLTLFPARVLQYSQINVCGRAGGPSSNGQYSRCQTGVYSRVGPPYIKLGAGSPVSRSRCWQASAHSTNLSWWTRPTR
jgi:hypothetical protein